MTTNNKTVFVSRVLWFLFFFLSLRAFDYARKAPQVEERPFIKLTCYSLPVQIESPGDQQLEPTFTIFNQMSKTPSLEELITTKPGSKKPVRHLGCFVDQNEKPYDIFFNDLSIHLRIGYRDEYVIEIELYKLSDKENKIYHELPIRNGKSTAISFHLDNIRLLLALESGYSKGGRFPGEGSNNNYRFSSRSCLTGYFHLKPGSAIVTDCKENATILAYSYKIEGDKLVIYGGIINQNYRQPEEQE